MAREMFCTGKEGDEGPPETAWLEQTQQDDLIVSNVRATETWQISLQQLNCSTVLCTHSYSTPQVKSLS